MKLVHSSWSFSSIFLLPTIQRRRHPQAANSTVQWKLKRIYVSFGKCVFSSLLSAGLRDVGCLCLFLKLCTSHNSSADKLRQNEWFTHLRRQKHQRNVKNTKNSVSTQKLVGLYSFAFNAMRHATAPHLTIRQQATNACAHPTQIPPFLIPLLCSAKAAE